jgi:hypothetical protein
LNDTEFYFDFNQLVNDLIRIHFIRRYEAAISETSSHQDQSESDDNCHSVDVLLSIGHGRFEIKNAFEQSHCMRISINYLQH